MSSSRTTHTGRRFTATPRLREEPDMERLVALILHMADQLHAEQQHHDRADETGTNEEGTDDDALTAHTSHG
ncbi:MAG TPA: hypothetical protein VGC18_06305 [Lacisediminihabitans sp.]|uniref:hypothetical protein n=1 Tax=Lacisediminihabitans sp. TaxID=2787631 RepID=UPI002ED7C0DB